MKSLSDPFIHRPVMTTLVMMAFLLFGIFSYHYLPVSDLPDVDFPTIQVSASLPGASPETMASAVATPLEKQFSTIAGIDSMSSTSFIGTTSITIQFSLDRNIDAAAQDVQAAISAALSTLPANMPNPPTLKKVNPADSPILYLALTSATLPLSELDEYGETLMAQSISMVSGVAQVEVYGSQKYAVRIELDPDALTTKSIGLDQVAAAISQANIDLPTGQLDGNHKSFIIQADGQIIHAAGYNKLIVAYRNGSPVRLRDLGRAVDSVENNKTAAWYVNAKGAQRSVILAIQRQPGTNTVAVVHDIRRLLGTLEQQIPPSVKLHVLFDRSESIRDSVDDTQFTLLLTLFLVVMVIFIFLRKASATLIPSLALPISLVGTFAVLKVLGYSLDNLSLMALTLSLGFVVDDAIVMLENIVRHMEMGQDVLTASTTGAREIGFTILSMTFSLAAVFIPVMFMGGIVGRLFHEFAVAIASTILISGLVSLTLTPMLASRFLKASHLQRHGRLYAWSERQFQHALNGYGAGLRWAMAHRRFMMVFSALVLSATVFLFFRMPKGFLPSEDNGRIAVFTRMAEGASFKSLVRHQQALAGIVQKDPAVEAFMSSVGARGTRAANTGILFIHLKPRGQRVSVDQVIARLRPKLAQEPGIMAFLQNPPPIRISGRLSTGQYELTLQGSDTDVLYRAAQRLQQKMQELPGILDLSSDLEMQNPQVQVHIDRDKAAALHVSAARIENTLYYAFGSRQISTIYAPDNTYRVIMELAEPFQQDISALSKLYVTSDTGELVPLAAVADFSEDLGPLAINHTGQQVSVTLSFNLKPGFSLGQAVGEVQHLAARVLPATVTTSFQGTAQAFQDSFHGLGLLLIMSILVIYMVLGILYESFTHPITILSALPFAGFGALVTLLIFKVDLNLYSFVGIIMLVGLVKKNGIMMVDFAVEAQRIEGKSAPEAIYQACLVRFRPIMMTTMAALMGTLPIAMGLGAGADSRRPLGLAVVGGLIFSQFLTLFITPVFFTYMESFRSRLSLWFPRSAAAPTSPDTGQLTQD